MSITLTAMPINLEKMSQKDWKKYYDAIEADIANAEKEKNMSFEDHVNTEGKLIAVYGTLRVGDYNFAAYSDGLTVVAKDVTLPGFKLYDFGGYPGVNKDPSREHFIKVDILLANEQTYKSITNMEEGAGYKTIEVSKLIPKENFTEEYQRFVPDNSNLLEVEANLYLYDTDLEKVNRGPLIPTGDWFNKTFESFEAGK
jgi:gamma-glutamylcyclotransferase (GGCT)/AIG2-like uncharacterized protein YtfP